MENNTCTSTADCIPPNSHDNEITKCKNNGECSCTEPFYGQLCSKKLTDTHTTQFALLMYPLMIIHLALAAICVFNLVQHRRKGGKVHQFSFIITGLMISCNLLSAGFYATGYNFDDGSHYIPFVPWSVYYLFEAGSCSAWGMAVTMVAAYWLDIFATHQSKRMLGDLNSKLKMRIPLAVFTVLHLILLVMLMTEYISYHTWIIAFVLFEILMVVGLLKASHMILKVIRKLQGGGEVVAIVTICLTVSLFCYIIYDCFYVFKSSNLTEVGPSGYLAAEAIAGWLWVIQTAFIMDIGFKGLKDPIKLRLVFGAILLMRKCLFTFNYVTHIHDHYHDNHPDHADEEGINPMESEMISQSSRASSVFETGLRRIKEVLRHSRYSRHSRSDTGDSDESSRRKLQPSAPPSNGAVALPSGTVV